jgi:hypothetical protein
MTTLPDLRTETMVVPCQTGMEDVRSFMAVNWEPPPPIATSLFRQPLDFAQIDGCHRAFQDVD